ncbi:MAG: amidohydrolase [Terriglobia bacterium]|jgi:imidazolonepropionase-like amidohydrolase
MRRIIIALSVSLALAGPVFGQSRTLVFRGAKVYSISNPPLEHGLVVVENGKIKAVGAEGQVAIPADATVVDVSGKVIIPGIVDTHSHIGIAGRPPVSANADVNEGTGPVEAALRALDAIWPADPGIRMATAGGITTANIMPGSGNVVGGQTAYVKLRGRTIEEMLIPGAIGGLKMANGENPKHYGARGQAPMTRMEEAALARRLFVRAQEYKSKWDDYNRAKAAGKTDVKPPERDLELEPMVEVLEGKRVVHHHTHRADDIMTVVRLSEEFHFRVVIHHGTEAYKVADELARQHIPVSLTLVDSPGGKEEALGLDYRSAGILERAGVKVALNTDDFIISSRFLLREAALAVRNGMSEAGALRALTLNPAEMLDLGSRVGSLDPGKDADLVVLSGPPFSVYTHVLDTYIGGEKVFDRSRPEDLHYATGGFAVADRYPLLGGGR